jgi:BON domain-containing protein
MRRFITLLASCFLSILLIAPASAASKAGSGTAVARSTPHTDSQIDTTIRTKLAKSKIGKDGFHFHVQHGVVTWEGTTNVIQHKGSATRMAKAAGATQVINNIQISDSAKSKATANLKHASVVQ